MEKFLKSGQLSQTDKNIKKLAKSLKRKAEEETLQGIVNFIRNFNFYDLEGKDLEKWKTVFLQRNASQILENKVSYGCDDHTILFVTLARELGIPAKFITAKRTNKSGMHAWPQVYIKGKWVDINATTGEIPFDYKKANHGPYQILSESLDPADSVMKNYQDWIKIEKLFLNSMPKATKINHVTLLVKDKEAAEKFYTEILGFGKHIVGKSLWIKIGNQFIHISDNSGMPMPNTFYHFAIEVENLSEFVKNIIAKGVDVFDLDKELLPFAINTNLDKEGRQFFIRDYDGNLIELVDAGNKFFNP